MKLIDLKTTNAAFNLAAEEYLFDRADLNDDICLIWQNSDSIIVGVNQNTLSEINADMVAERKIPVIRRLSGGGAVFHDLSNINYSFITKYSDQEDLNHFTGPIIDFLKGLGIAAENNGRNDICINGKKISGTAKYVKDGKALFHGTLLFDADPSKMESFLKTDPEKFKKKGIRSFRSRVAGISDFLDQKIPLRVFKKMLCDHLSADERIELSIDDFSAILDLMKDKYTTDEWNYGHFTGYSYLNKKSFPYGIVSLGMNIKDGIITDAKFFGDFFSTLSIKGLESSLIGKNHSPGGFEQILIALGNDPGRYITGMTAEDLKSLFF